jgi:hypothetical protein
MILKYYTNGWNFVDIGENVQAFNVDISELNKKIKMSVGTDTEGRPMTDEEYRDALYVRLSNKVFELGRGTSINKGSIQSIMGLTDVFYRFCNANREDTVYLRYVLFYDKQGVYTYLVYQGASHLMNDDGKTLETLSRDRQIDWDSGGSSELAATTKSN